MHTQRAQVVISARERLATEPRQRVRKAIDASVWLVSARRSGCSSSRRGSSNVVEVVELGKPTAADSFGNGYTRSCRATSRTARRPRRPSRNEVAALEVEDRTVALGAARGRGAFRAEVHRSGGSTMVVDGDDHRDVGHDRHGTSSRGSFRCRRATIEDLEQPYRASPTERAVRGTALRGDLGHQPHARGHGDDGRRRGLGRRRHAR